MLTFFRSGSIYRSMTALTSLIHLSVMQRTATGKFIFLAAVTDVEPLISHINALIDDLEDSNEEKQVFRALVGLARATALLHQRPEIPDGFAQDIRERLIKLLRAYKYVLCIPFARLN